MRNFVASACFLALNFATPATVERNLAPKLANEPDVCPEQPPEPEWMQNIEVRESYKRLLVQQIYRAESMQRIVAAQSCECHTRYPSWDAAEMVYFEAYAASEYREMVEATSEFRRLANKLRLEAMPICEAAGNW